MKTYVYDFYVCLGPVPCQERVVRLDDDADGSGFVTCSMHLHSRFEASFA